MRVKLVLTDICDDGESYRCGHSPIENWWVWLVLDGYESVGANVPVARQTRN